MRRLALERRAKEVIIDIIRKSDVITVDEIMDMVRPHINFDYETAKEQVVRRTANQLASCVRDDDEVRIMFACKQDGIPKYINVDKSNDLVALKTVDADLRKKMFGIEKSHAKVSRRCMEIEGQMSLDLEQIK